MKLLLLSYLLHTCLAQDQIEKNNNNWWFILFIFLGTIIFFFVLTYYSDKAHDKARKSQNGQSEQLIGQSEQLIDDSQLKF
tara:strand:+ start:379 stop:621 length:243 start_codon:yes stop_codon:yes gene_type:complete